jgi:hypothetical protein
MIFSLLCLMFDRIGLTVQASNTPQEVLRLDDSTWQILPGNHKPWTYPPVCTSKIERMTIDDDTTFCLYTQQGFANGHGMVVFTTPSTAEILSNSKHFNTNDSIINDFNLKTPSYESRDIPGKGIGIVANRTILRGERIITEFPVVIYDEQLARSVNKRHLDLLLDEGFSQLPQDTQAQISRLHKATTSHPSFRDILLSCEHFQPYQMSLPTSAAESNHWPNQTEAP